MAGLPHFTLGALLAVAGAGLVTVAAASWQRRRCPREPVRRGRTAPWVVVLGALSGWELLAFSLSPRSRHPTLSSIADAVLRPRPLEALAFLAWLALGWSLARR